MQGYLHQFHFLAMKADSLRINVLMMCCSVTACTWGRSSQKQLQWMTLRSFWKTEGSPYHQKKFRLKAKITHAIVVTACEEKFATQMTVQTTALRGQLMPFRLQIQTKTASNLTTCVIVQGAHASKFPIPKDKQEDGVVVASGVGNQLVSHPGLDSVSTVDRTVTFSLHTTTPGILT